MKKAMLMAIVLFASLLGGYLSPHWGITLFFLLTVLLFFRIGPDIRLEIDEVLALLFACCAAASALYASDKWGAILFSGSFIAGSFFYVTLRNSSNWELPLMKSIVIAGCIVGLCEAFHRINLLPHGVFYNANPYSGFITPLVPISFYLYSKCRKKVYLFASTLLVFANLISASRTGVATMILACVAVALFFYQQKDKDAVKKVVLVFFAGFCSFLLFSEAKDVFAVKEAVGMLEKQPAFLLQRAYLLKVTLQIIREAPLLGHGLNSFFAVMSTITNPYVIYPSIHAHSLYLNIMAELGIVGIGPFLALLIVVVKGRLCSSFLLKVALFAFLFHNMVEYNFPPPPFQVLFYLLCAAIMQEKQPATNLLHIRGRKARIIPVFLALYFILVHLFPVMGVALLNKADAALQVRDVPKALRYLFASTYFGYSVSSLHASTGRVLTQVYFLSSAKDDNLTKIAEKNYLKALALNGMDGSLYTDIASFYELTGRPDKAQAYLHKVIQTYPYHQEYRLALARFYSGQGRYREAIGILEAANTFLKNYAPLIPLRVNVLVGLARLYRQEGDRINSEDSLAKARRLKGVLEGPESIKQEKKDASPLPAR